jgi:hypothetical protein
MSFIPPRAAAVVVLLLGAACGDKKSASSDAGGATASASSGALAPSASASAEPPKPQVPQTPMTTIATAADQPWGVAADAHDVFWTSNASGSKGVRRVPRGGGLPATVCTITDPMQAVEDILVDEASVWLLAPSIGTGALYRAPKGAKNARCDKIADGVPLLHHGMVKLGDKLYFLTAPAKAKTSTLVAVDAAGKSTTVADLGKLAGGLTTDGVDLYFTTAELVDRQLLKIAPTGGAPTAIGKGGLHPRFDGGKFFFVGAGLSSMPKTGGEPTKLFTAQATTGDFAIVGSVIYVGATTLDNASRLMKGTTAGNDFVPHATLPGAIVRVVADARDVYVTTADKQLLRIAP